MIMIQKGKVQVPPKVVIYGPEGIGKSTLATKFPNPLFLDLEHGTHRLDVHRIDTLDGVDLVEAVIRDLSKDTMGYETLVLDTADKLEALLIDEVCKKHNKSGIEDFGFGKGHTYLKERWNMFLRLIDDFRTKTGVGIVLIAHAAQRKVELPEETGSYDHWELKLSKQTSPLLKEWSDFLLFIKYDIIIVSQGDGKGKAQGGERVVCTGHTPYYDAKSREHMEPTIKLDRAGAYKIVGTITGTNPAEVRATPQAPSPAPAPALAPAPAPAPAQTPILAAQEQVAPEADISIPDPADEAGCNNEDKWPGQSDKLAQLDNLMALSGCSWEDLELATSHPKINMHPKGTDIRDFSERSIDRLLGGWDAVMRTVSTLKGVK